jgi:hypothetical protein
MAATHEHNGHGHSHDDHNTEGNRQYYPKSWWIPLVGLFVVAFGFSLLAGWILGMSGTDKWGKTHATEESHHHGAPALDQDHHQDMKPTQDPKQNDQDTAKRVDSASGLDSGGVQGEQRSPGDRSPHTGHDHERDGH